jgi:hypothetical protein
MHIRDRIKELRRVRASELRPSPRNWRTHPAAPRDAVGYADALLARELEDGALELVDGHLRAETTPEAMVPVLVLDVSPEEADKILLTLDPLASLAGVETTRLAELLASVDFRSSGVEQLLDELTKTAAEAEAELEVLSTPREVEVPESYQVVVECADEADQQAVYTRMREEGYQCRVLTL